MDIEGSLHDLQATIADLRLAEAELVEQVTELLYIQALLAKHGSPSQKTSAPKTSTDVALLHEERLIAAAARVALHRITSLLAEATERCRALEQRVRV